MLRWLIFLSTAHVGSTLVALLPNHRATSLLLQHAPPQLLLRRGVRRAGPLHCAASKTHILENRDEYDALIEKATAENRVVAIKFYAGWCRACKAMKPKYDRVTEDWPDVEFYELLFENNKALCRELGIKVLPYVEIIAGDAGKVEGFTCGSSKIPLLQEKLEAHGHHGQCGDEDSASDLSSPMNS